jgi:hypothetical protein
MAAEAMAVEGLIVVWVISFCLFRRPNDKSMSGFGTARRMALTSASACVALMILTAHFEKPFASAPGFALSRRV